MARRRPARAAGRRNRETLLFYVLAASIVAQIAAVFADSGVFVALFTVTGLLLSAMVIHS